MFCINCGKELPDTAKFCYACGFQIENQKQKEEIEQKEKEEEFIQETKTDSRTEDVIRQGMEALSNMQLSEAHQFFQKAIEIDTTCAEAYWGFVLIVNKCKNMEEFILKHTKDTEEVTQEFCEVVNQEECIQNAIKKYEIKGFLYQEKIKQIFSYSNAQGYYSKLKFRETQYENEKKYFQEDKYLSKVFQYAKGEFYKEICKMQQTIYLILEDRLNKAKENDKMQLECITKKYQNFLEQAEKKGKEEYEEACKQQASCYEAACKFMGEGKYAIAIARFEKLGHYQNSITLLAECKKRENQTGELITSNMQTNRNDFPYVGGYVNNSYNKYYSSPGEQVRGILIKIMGFAGIILMILFAIGIVEMKKEEKKYIQFVKSGSPDLYPDITYEEAFHAFFDKPHWKYFEAGTGEDIVEFTGNCLYYDAKVKATIQFVLDYKNNTFELKYLDFNDLAQNEWEAYGMITTVFESFREEHPGRFSYSY